MNWSTRRGILLGSTSNIAFGPPDEGAGGGEGGENKDGEDKGAGEEGTDRSEKPHDTKIQGGLLDRRKKPDEDGGEGGDKKAEVEDDDRPEGIPEKFWDAEKKTVKSDDLGKAYSELEKAHGKLKREKSIGGEVPESPDDYFKDGLDLGDDVDRLSVDGPDDPGLKAWGKVCHKYGIGGELAVNLAKDMFGMMNQHAPAPIDPDAEFEALGKGGDAIIDGVFTWVEGAEASGRLSEDDIEVVNNLSKTANGIKFLAAMRSMSGEERIPIIPSTGQRGMSQEQWDTEMKDAIKAKDYKRQAELEEMGAAINGEGTGPRRRLVSVNSEK